MIVFFLNIIFTKPVHKQLNDQRFGLELKYFTVVSTDNKLLGINKWKPPGLSEITPR